MNEKQIIRAIQNYFGDTSRSQEETLDGLVEISDAVQTYIETLEADLQED